MKKQRNQPNLKKNNQSINSLINKIINQSIKHMNDLQDFNLSQKYFLKINKAMRHWFTQELFFLTCLGSLF